MPPRPLLAMTFPGPTMLYEERSSRETPKPGLRWTDAEPPVPARLVPTKLPMTSLWEVDAWCDTSMPSLALPETTLPSPGARPPTFVYDVPLLTSIPSLRLRTRVLPLGERPMIEP